MAKNIKESQERLRGLARAAEVSRNPERLQAIAERIAKTKALAEAMRQA